MPRILDYSAPQRGLSLPNAQPDRIATGQEGRGLEQAGRGLMDLGLGITDAVQKRQVQNDLTNVHVKMAEVTDDFTAEIDEGIRSGNIDPKEISNGLTERFNEISEGVESNQGKDTLTRHQATLRSQLMKFAVHGRASLDGDIAVENINKFWSANGSSLLKDPSSFPDKISAQREYISSLQASKQISAVKAQELNRIGEERLATDAIRGWADSNPKFAKDMLASEEYSMVGGKLRHQLSGEIDQAIRGEEVEVERRKRVQAEALQKQQLVVQNDFLEKMSKGELTAKDILKSRLDPFGSGSKDQFIRMLKAENEKGGRLETNPQVFFELFNRVNLPDGDPNKISVEADLNEYLGNGLSYTDLGKLRGEVSGRKTEQGQIENELKKQLFDIAKGKLTKSNSFTGISDPEGDERMQKFMILAYDQIAEAKKAGKPVKDLFDPASKDYVGKYINNYKRTPQEIIRSMSQEFQRKSNTTPSKGLVDNLDDGKQKPNQSGLPRSGDIVGGYKYVGPDSNDPADRKNPKNWKKH